MKHKYIKINSTVCVQKCFVTFISFDRYFYFKVCVAKENFLDYKEWNKFILSHKRFIWHYSVGEKCDKAV